MTLAGQAQPHGWRHGDVMTSVQHEPQPASPPPAICIAKTCPTCRGQGELPWSPSGSMNDPHVQHYKCAVCGGEGRISIGYHDMRIQVHTHKFGILHVSVTHDPNKGVFRTAWGDEHSSFFALVNRVVTVSNPLEFNRLGERSYA